MRLLGRLLGIPDANSIAMIVAPSIVANLDKYHTEWAGFNKEIEGRVVSLEKARADTVALEVRLQALEQDRNKLRVDVEGTLEVAQRLYNRLRMRHQRELEGAEPVEEQNLLQLRDKREWMGA